MPFMYRRSVSNQVAFIVELMYTTLQKKRKKKCSDQDKLTSSIHPEMLP